MQRLRVCFWIVLAVWLRAGVLAQPVPEFVWPSHLEPTPDAIEGALRLAAESANWETTPPVRLDLPGIENAWQINFVLLAGDGPPDREALSVLRRVHDVKTIISTDQVPPDPYVAAEYDIDVIHVPMRPGRLQPGEFFEIVGEMHDTEGAFYLHGAPGDLKAIVPAVLAAHMWEGRGRAGALSRLEAIGLPRERATLWYDATTTQLTQISMKRAGAVPGDALTGSETPPLAWWMNSLEEHFVSLREAGRYAWEPFPAGLGTTPAEEAEAIALLARDWLRTHPGGDADFRERFGNLRSRAEDLREAIRSGDQAAASRAWIDVQNTCLGCHATYRDAP